MLLVLFVMVMFVASFLSAILGSGSALVAVPLALLFLPKEAVVSSMLIACVALNGFMSITIKEPISLRPVLRLFLASVIGMPLGVWILRTLPLPTMQVFVGCLVIVFTALLQWGRLRLPQSTFLTGLAGFFSGLLDTSTTMSGPPVLILLAGQGLPKDQFRRTLVCFFLASDLAAALTLALSGVMTLQRISYGVAAIPFVFLAGYVGDRMSARLPEKPFRLLVVAVLFLAGAYSVVSGLS
ncbi:MAG TPA: sulfite exporter TauE/SafE family protein [Anaerolineae bacterium]|nr:sulfite exporter TauE/SafE family protein [Anaerolineae bacterium]